MNIDVAVRAENLTTAIHNRISAIPVCVGQPLTGPLQGMVLDRVEVEPPTLSESQVQLPIRLSNGNETLISAHKVRATFVVRVHVATMSALEDAGPNVPDTIPLEFEIMLDLSGELDLDENGNVIGAGVRTEYAGKSVVLPDADLDGLIDSLLSDASQFVPLDLAPLADALGSGGAMRNFGLALGQAEVVIRLEIGSVVPNPSAAWTSFFSGPPSWRGGRDWAIFVDQALICEATEARLAEEMANSEAEGEIEVLEQPSANWLGWTGTPSVMVSAYIDAVEACPNGLDIGVEIGAFTALSLQPGPELRLDTTVSWNLIDSDVLLCGITVGIAGAIFGAVIGAGGGPIGAAVGAVIGMVGSIIAVATIADAIDPPSLGDGDCEETESGDDHALVVCHQPLPMPDNPLLGAMDPDQLVGNAHGMILRGTSDVQPLDTGLLVKVVKFTWSSQLNCNTKSVDVALAGGAGLSGPAGALLVGCGAESRDDPLSYFTPTLTSSSFQVLGLKVQFDASKQSAYEADPYPCKVLVHTSRGARLLNLGVVPEPPVPPTQDELIAAIASHCLKAAEDSSKIHALWRLWLPDPPPEKWATLQQWDVAMANADPGTRLQLVEKGGAVLSEQGASARGVARLQLVRTPARLSDENGLTVQVVLPDAVATPVGEETRELPMLSIAQTQLVQARLLPLPAAPRALSRVGGAQPLLAVVADDWLVTFGRHPAAALAPTAQVWLPGLRGVITDPSSAGGIIAFGEFGLIRFAVARGGSLDFAGHWQLEECARPVVRDALSVGDVTALLTEEGLVLHREGRIPRRLAAPADAVLAEYGGRLAVFSPGRDEVLLYDVRRDLPTAPAARVRVPPAAQPVDVGRSRARPVGDRVFTVHARNGGWSAPEVRSRAPGWYDTAVAMGPWVARLDQRGRVGLWQTSRPVEGKALLART